LTPQGACLSAGWFWRKHGLNECADVKEYVLMTKRINGGNLGYDDRVAKMDTALGVLTA
jgi:putative chitinase